MRSINVVTLLVLGGGAGTAPSRHRAKPRWQRQFGGYRTTVSSSSYATSRGTGSQPSPYPRSRSRDKPEPPPPAASGRERGANASLLATAGPGFGGKSLQLEGHHDRCAYFV